MALSAFCIMSCSEMIHPEPQNGTNSITVTSYVDPQVKAGYEGTSVVPDEFYLSIDQAGVNRDYHKKMIKGETGQDGVKYAPDDNTGMTWQDTDHSDVFIKAMTAPYGLSNVDGVSAMTVAINSNQSSVNNVKSCDLLGATSYKDDCKGVSIIGDNIQIIFKHLMSKLMIEYNSLPSGVSVNSIGLKNVCVKGGYSYASMNYDSSIPLGFGDITMYHESGKRTAEAIFFPYTPKTAPKVVVEATINGQIKVFECPIRLKSESASFEGGKLYIMSLTITEVGIEGVVTLVKEWDDSIHSTTFPHERILWVGTSIPAGGYPQIVGQALNCQVINNAVGGSLVSMQPDKTAAFAQGWNHLIAGALSQTIAEANLIYKDCTQEQLDQVRALSYESLIIPYIDGTDGVPQCTTVIIDHGYNDLSAILYERNAHWGSANEPYRGYEHLMEMINGTETYSEYYNYITSAPWNFFDKGCYIIAMSHIIKEIQKRAQNDVRIIIGNYFTSTNPLLSFIYKSFNETPDSPLNGSYPDYNCKHPAKYI